MELVSSAKERPTTTARDGFEVLCRDHNRTLVRALRAKVGSLQVAEDIAQETYAKLLGRLTEAGHDTIYDLPGYLYKMAFNLAKDHIRHQAVAVHKLLLLQNSYPEDLSPEHMSDAARSQLEQALQQLSPECREALHHVWVMEKTAHEAAGDLGVPATTIRGRVERALKQLKLILTGAEDK
jgi:RNA polymerase sigma-70 factor (ECF subfamily)